MSNDLIKAEVLEVARAARAASGELGLKSLAERDGALRAMAAALRAHAGEIVAANARDMEVAREAGTKESLLDRLMLDEGRVAGVGTHAELMESCPEYREIALSQLSEEELAEGGAR